MARQILYHPEKTVSEEPTKKEKKQPAVKTQEKPKIEPEGKREATLQERSESIYKWLKQRPLINLNGVCTKVGVDRANFVKAMDKKKELKVEIIEKMVTELKAYGYAE